VESCDVLVASGHRWLVLTIHWMMSGLSGEPDGAIAIEWGFFFG